MNPRRLQSSGIWLLCLFLLAGLSACGEPTATPSPATLAPTSTVSYSVSTLTPVVANLTVTATIVVATAVPVPSFTPTLARATTTSPVAKTSVIASTPAVDALPAPPAARKLNLTVEMLQRLQRRLGVTSPSIDLTRLKLAAFATNALPVDVLAFYQLELQRQGWQETRLYDRRLATYFEKNGQIEVVATVGVPDEATVNFLANFVPEIRGQIQGGETLVVLAQGPASIFEVLKK